MSCEYCDFGDYRGKEFKKVRNIDGGYQNFEICLFDSPEDECAVLEIGGGFTDIRVEINYCPMCGGKV
jgi:hypothetical protein